MLTCVLCLSKQASGFRDVSERTHVLNFFSHCDQTWQSTQGRRDLFLVYSLGDIPPILVAMLVGPTSVCGGVGLFVAILVD